MPLILVLGGARSGKSRHAQHLALTGCAAPVYVATSRRWDAEHEERIDRHRRERGPEWRTVEEPLALASVPAIAEAYVVDCLTLWLTNLIADAPDDWEGCLGRARAELDALARRPETFVLVSNELGTGLHAPTELGRRFVDLQGFVNQHAASLAQRVVLMVAGLPLMVKS